MTARAARLTVHDSRKSDAWTVRGVMNAALTLPIIYSLIVPLAVLDFWVSLYQALCFGLLGIAPVARRDYFVLDRHRLGYLNALEKVNCAYCGYATGVIGFVREVSARAEQYWCPIKHARTPAGAHRRHRRFAQYGDATAYHRLLPDGDSCTCTPMTMEARLTITAHPVRVSSRGAMSRVAFARPSLPAG